MKKDFLKVFVFLATVVAIFAYSICMIYFYDPLQLFSEKYPKYYSNDFRITAKRLAAKYDFDGVILGSSMMVNQDAKELKNATYINLSLAGSTIGERLIVLDYLIKTKNITNIVTSLDGNWKFKYPSKEIYKIYNKISTLELIKSYYSLLEKKCIFVPLNKCKGSESDSPQYLINIDFSTTYKLNPDDFVDEKLPLNEAYGYEELEDFVKKHPSINFHIIMPPYSTLFHKKLIKKLALSTSTELLLKRNKQIVQNLAKAKNAKFYFFSNEDFTDNLNNYDEYGYHYRQNINTLISEAINEGKNIITVENIDEYFDNFIKKVRNYDIETYKKALK